MARRRKTRSKQWKKPILPLDQIIERDDISDDDINTEVNMAEAMFDSDDQSKEELQM